MWLLALLGGKLKIASASLMFDSEHPVSSESTGDLPDIYMEEEIDPFGHTILVHFEDGTSRSSDSYYVDVCVAAKLLGTFTDYHETTNSHIEMKYYAIMGREFKIYLLRNRVMLRENKGLWHHLNIREKGPVVVCKLDKKPKPILPSTQQRITKTVAIKVSGQTTGSISLPISSMFSEIRES